MTSDIAAGWIARGLVAVRGYVEQHGLGMPLTGYLLAVKNLQGEFYDRPMNLHLYDVENVGQELFMRGLAQAADVCRAKAIAFSWINRDEGIAVYTARTVGPDGELGPLKSWIAGVSEAEGVTRCAEFEPFLME